MATFTPDPARVQELAREVIATEFACAGTTDTVAAWATDWPEYPVLDPEETVALIDAVTRAVKDATVTVSFPSHAEGV